MLVVLLTTTKKMKPWRPDAFSEHPDVAAIGSRVSQRRNFQSEMKSPTCHLTMSNGSFCASRGLLCSLLFCGLGFVCHPGPIGLNGMQWMTFLLIKTPHLLQNELRHVRCDACSQMLCLSFLHKSSAVQVC